MGSSCSTSNDDKKNKHKGRRYSCSGQRSGEEFLYKLNTSQEMSKGDNDDDDMSEYETDTVEAIPRQQRDSADVDNTTVSPMVANLKPQELGPLYFRNGEPLPPLYAREVEKERRQKTMQHAPPPALTLPGFIAEDTNPLTVGSFGGPPGGGFLNSPQAGSVATMAFPGGELSGTHKPEGSVLFSPKSMANMTSPFGSPPPRLKSSSTCRRPSNHSLSDHHDSGDQCQQEDLHDKYMDLRSPDHTGYGLRVEDTADFFNSTPPSSSLMPPSATTPLAADRRGPLKFSAENSVNSELPSSTQNDNFHQQTQHLQSQPALSLWERRKSDSTSGKKMSLSGSTPTGGPPAHAGPNSFVLPVRALKNDTQNPSLTEEPGLSEVE